MQGYHVIHHGWLAEVRTGNEFGLLGSRDGSIDQNKIAYLSPDVSSLSVFQNIDNQPHLTVASVTGLPCFAIRSGEANQPGRGDGGPLCAQLRQRRYQK